MSEEMSVGMKICMGVGFVFGIGGFCIGGIVGGIVGMAAGIIFIGAPIGGIVEGIKEAKA